jgi:hypothetical protein
MAPEIAKMSSVARWNNIIMHNCSAKKPEIIFRVRIKLEEKLKRV